jgi:hypothetical protein
VILEVLIDGVTCELLVSRMQALQKTFGSIDSLVEVHALLFEPVDVGDYVNYAEQRSAVLAASGGRSFRPQVVTDLPTQVSAARAAAVLGV